MSIDIDDYRDDTPKEAFKDPTARPLEPTEETLKRWEAMSGRERFRDSDYMRMLQSRRTPESLAQSGKRGFEVTAERHGYDAGMEHSARWFREHPERASEPERRMMELLERQGQKMGEEYQYIYKAAPGVWVDYAWPDRMKYIEVWGGVHNQETLERIDPETAEARVQRDSEHIEQTLERGWTGKVVMAHELKPGQIDETERHVREFLDPRPLGEKPPIPGVFEPPREDSEEKLQYAAEQRLEKLLLERGQVMSLHYARDFRITRDHRVSFAWLDTHRAVQIYPDEATAKRDEGRVRALEQKGWSVLQITRDADLLPQNEKITTDTILAWVRGEQQ